ncbi:PREDICTED: pectinesterase-like [Tarenaya hassleriana]|uniref:pectinesterase-like n=1 Tax=Tarenaya hassleriana TaxID=28532 RepID=UPI00053C8A25|nr:PREDICTED: pectinesterase-like [Tarenaya hassleriana]
MLRNAFLDRVRHVERLCSIALAMIKTTDISNSKLKDGTSTGPNIIEEVSGGGHVDGDQWPLWLSEEDRQLLQSESVKADAVVAEDGSGDYTTVAAAVEAAPSNNEKRCVIRIKTGVYRENVRVMGHRKNIMVVGDGRLHTFITGNRSVANGWSPFQSATVGVISEGFLARDITFENTGGSGNGAAVALRVGSDKSAFYRCGFSSYERTLHVQSKRQFFADCFITGNRDIIYGNSAAFFQGSDIRVRQQFLFIDNIVTAQSRSDQNQDTGIVIQNSRIEASDLDHWLYSTTYLGRPEREFARSVVMQSYISDLLRPDGWQGWGVTFELDNLTFREYQNRGMGANTKRRVKWKSFKVITDPEEAEQFTTGPFIDGGSWLKGTGFPFKLDL